MGLMERIKKTIEKIKNFYITEEIAHAVLILAAWITTADGEIKESEVEATERFIQEFDFFEKFNKKTLNKEYRKWLNKFTKDPEDAIPLALNGIYFLKDSEEAAPAMKLALAIANADGDFCDAEKDAVKRAAHYLGLDEKEFIKS